VRRDAEQEKKKEKIHKIYKISLACEQEKIHPQDLAREQENYAFLLGTSTCGAHRGAYV